MAQRRHHYDRAFERFLRERRIPYISVDEARKALLPEGARLGVSDGARLRAIKSFDFVIYTPQGNVIVDVKGRRCPARVAGGAGRARLESWVTREDIESMALWETLLGPRFRAAFVFLYWCEVQPADALFQEVFEDRGRWYAVRTVELEPYRAHMRIRSHRWGTVHLGAEDFERLSEPFVRVRSPSRDGENFRLDSAPAPGVR
ncbi:MAG TPA: hypothetical protein DEB06_05920 [Phycisphaerales bacterium]|nr:hypothetical protein [Phycisphaerales bacterium]